MNKALKIMVIISMILIVAGSLLAVIGYESGGFKSIILGPDGFYVNDIDMDSIDLDSIDINFIDINFSDADRFEKIEDTFSDFT